MRVEHVHETAAGTRHVILFVGVLFRIGDNDVAVEVANSERPVACRNIWISEWESGRLESKIRVVRLNVAGVKVRYVQKILIIGDAYSHAFVNCACGASVHSCERVRVVEIGVPAGNHSVFADEDEFGGKSVSAVTDAKGRCVVPHHTSWV